MRVLITFALPAVMAQFAPVTFNNGADVEPACQKIDCAPLECPDPFKWVNAKDAGTCCPVCFNENIKPDIPKPEQLPGAEPHPSAPESCKLPQKAYCAILSCPPGYEETYVEDDCCSKCSKSA